ncbi:hypothetical protein JAAARDRAFT_189835 [Jaapia argillacea MUCL 33604]|uniref:Vacuolar fusion protein MON1 n=1 Tax=Jaapia argillacea MUCL 33604 TaxID=933084 RepID=A0A067Q649_9AGAM|nr:hypothetical protein JAAARDRAFT_189835 [Jaapia argillacea MUCL 33604]
MPETPRSRKPSRAGTPIPGAAPSRLNPPLRPTHSLSSLQVYTRKASSTPPSPGPIQFPSSTSQLDVGSSASSVINMDVSEGILVPEADVEVDTVEGEEGSAIGRVAAPSADEDSKKHLRDQLRRTLSNKGSNPDMASRPSRKKTKSTEMDGLSHVPVDLYPPRQYFVLTEAGKPVFIRTPSGDDSDMLTSVIGIIQALISVFLDDNDKIRCINAGSTRITFLLRPPLYYVCVSSWGEPESLTRTHLEYLHLQILSVVTASQLRRIFERRNNFDLRRLLSGAENILSSLLDRLEWDLALSMSSLHCLRLDPTLRSKTAEALVPHSKMKDILYVILVASGHVVTLVRPKKHSIHPADLHILINTIHAPSIINSPASISWLPLCLPKFNPSGFVNTYVNFLTRPEDQDPAEAKHTQQRESPPHDGSEITPDLPAEPENGSTSTPSETQSLVGSIHETPQVDPGVGLVCISGGGDFEAIRNWCDSVTSKMKKDGILDAITNAVRTHATSYSVSELGIPGLRHFIYKSRPHVQITVPLFEDPYDSTNDKQRLVTLYQTMHDAIHSKSGQEGTLKLQYIRTEKESVMGWITQPFELYVALSPLLPKSAAVGAANAVARWVKKEEGRLFLRDAPVF